MTSSIQAIVLVVLVMLAAAYLLANQANLDIAGPLRNRLWERDARRMRARASFPETIARSYWSRREYQKDRARLEALGYRVASEAASDPYVTMPAFASFGRTRPPPRRRRVPMFHVVYERAVLAERNFVTRSPASSRAGEPRRGDQPADVEEQRDRDRDAGPGGDRRLGEQSRHRPCERRCEDRRGDH